MKNIHIRCTDREKKTIELLAKDAGAEKSTWAREIFVEVDRSHRAVEEAPA